MQGCVGLRACTSVHQAVFLRMAKYSSDRVPVCHRNFARWLEMRSLAHHRDCRKSYSIMPFVHVTWIPKACRNQAVREEVAAAVRKAMVSVKSADISPDNLVVRFSESVDVSVQCSSLARSLSRFLTDLRIRRAFRCPKATVTTRTWRRLPRTRSNCHIGNGR